MLLYTNIDQTLVNSLHGLLNCEIGGLDGHVITTEYRTRVHCTHVTPILQCIGPCDLFRSFRSIFLYNTLTLNICITIYLFSLSLSN